MTLEQRIIRALAEGNQAVADALRFGIFGPDAQAWFISWNGELTEEDYESPPWVRVH